MSRGGKREGAGRKKGSVAGSTKLLREAIIEAGEAVGFDGAGADGMVGYLKARAADSPTAFMQLIGKVLPMQVEGAGEGGEHVVVTKIELVAPSVNDTA